MKINKIKELDLFYTKSDVALQCYNVIKNILGEFINNKTLWIEPSVGSGSFFNIIEGRKKGFDIYPRIKNKNIKELDFLEDNRNILPYTKNSIVIGNPPFGKRAKKAISFFNKASTISNHIGFIVPNQFKKYSAQSKLNKNFKLIHELELDENSFISNGKDYKVRCIFQIWTCLETPLINLRIKEPPKIKHDDFEIFQYNNTKEALKYFNKELYQWDFAVPRQGFYDYSLRIKNENDLNKKIQWAFFKAKNKNVLKRLNNIDFEKLARNNTSILGFGKHDVVSEYMSMYD